MKVVYDENDPLAWLSMNESESPTFDDYLRPTRSEAYVRAGLEEFERQREVKRAESQRAHEDYLQAEEQARRDYERELQHRRDVEEARREEGRVAFESFRSSTSTPHTI